MCECPAVPLFRGWDRRKNNKGTADNLLSLFVGVARLERATACTPCKNASQLHHTPIALAAAKVRMFFELTLTLSEKFYLCQQITLNSKL